MCSPEAAPSALRMLAPGLNAYTLRFDPDLLKPLQAEFNHSVQPWLQSKPGQRALQGGRLLRQALPGRQYAVFSYNTYPLLWIAHHNAERMTLFQRLFRQLGLDLHLQTQVQPLHRVRFYAGFFVVGQQAPAALWHDDYAPAAPGYTLITPLYPLAPEHGHLLYKTADGQEAIYRYQSGEAVLIGAGLQHSTQPYAPSGQLRVLLSLTLGSDRLRDWPLLAPTIGRQARYFQLPCGHIRGQCLCRLWARFRRDLA
ncbi:MAG: hypothetical protein IGS03_04385 [Candidatus Sericytochromatia bacterium]|nr:hypothetical protein [Candidatus Sericytochromatia bacterium]